MDVKTPRLTAEAVAKLDLETLVQLADSIGGHWTLLRFTTHWKCVYGTPDLSGAHSELAMGYEQVLDLPAYPTMKDALVALILNRPRV